MDLLHMLLYIDHHETAISCWSKEKTRATKIDPRYCYRHNLHFYYVKWLESQSREPFFYRRDIGKGKEVNLVEKCPQWKLQQQCIKYLGWKEGHMKLPLRILQRKIL